MAQAVNHLLTWGMSSPDREQYLAESLSDWEAMAAEQAPRKVLWRAIRGIPAAVWIRLDDRAVTAMPAGLALSTVGLGGMASASWGSPYPAPFREFVLLACLGLLLVGLNLVRDPRRLVLASFRAAAAFIAVGFTGLAFNLPTAAQWPYEGPVLEHYVMDRALQLSFLMLAAGSLLIIVASYRTGVSRLVPTAAVLLVTGTAIIGVTQVAWGVTLAPVDLAMTAASIAIGLGALSFTHVVPRLRHLQLVSGQPDLGRLGRRRLRKGSS